MVGLGLPVYLPTWETGQAPLRGCPVRGGSPRAGMGQLPQGLAQNRPRGRPPAVSLEPLPYEAGPAHRWEGRGQGGWVSLLFWGDDKSHEVLLLSPPFLSPSSSARTFFVYPTQTLERTGNLIWREMGRSRALSVPWPPTPSLGGGKVGVGGLWAPGLQARCEAVWLWAAPWRLGVSAFFCSLGYDSVVLRRKRETTTDRWLSCGGCFWEAHPFPAVMLTDTLTDNPAGQGAISPPYRLL